ncbi:unnamed protein product, partial [Rotaria sp. Silwood1]
MPSVVATTTISPQRTGAALVLNWTYVDGTTTIAIATNYLGTSQWLGIGLSLDDRMGNDHVFVCQRLSDDTIQLQRFINPNGHSYPTLMTADSNLGGIFQIKRIALNNGVAYCEFTLSNFINTADRRKKRSVSLLSQSTQYIVLVAIGSLDSSNSLVQHFLTHVLSQTIQLNQPGIITINNFEGSVVLIRAHGIIMLFIWMLCVSTSIILARYFKKSWPTRKICDKPIWFAIHRLVMTFAAIMTVFAFILILIYKRGKWTSSNLSREYAHSITGMFVVIAAIVQPMMALFRCHPDHRYRFIFNYAHAMVGIGALILSITAIFLATLFTSFNSELSNYWKILVAW